MTNVLIYRPTGLIIAQTNIFLTMEAWSTAVGKTRTWTENLTFTKSLRSPIWEFLLTVQLRDDFFENIRNRDIKMLRTFAKTRTKRWELIRLTFRKISFQVWYKTKLLINAVKFLPNLSKLGKTYYRWDSVAWRVWCSSRVRIPAVL